MNLTRLRIDQYGPLRDVDVVLESGVHLFAGDNESGKTLLVEALIKLLLEGQTGQFPGLDRVDGSPAGFLALERDGEEILLPDHGFDEAAPAVTPGDVRNALVVRDVDLRRPARKRDFGNAAYFREVTDRITGAETRRIEAVRDELADIGHLTNNTSDARLSNRKPLKLSDSRNRAETVGDELEEYLAECRETGILQQFRRKRALEADREAVVREIEQLEEAERVATLERGRDLCNQLDAVRGEMADHEARESGEIKQYRDLRNSIAAYRQRRRAADVRPEFYRRGLAVSIWLFALSLLATVVSPLPGLQLLTVLLFLVTLAIGYKHRQARALDKEAEDLVDHARQLGVDGETLTDVDHALEEAIDGHERQGKKLEKEETRLLTQLRELFDDDGETVDYWRDRIEELEADVPDVDAEFDPDRLAELEDRRVEIDGELTRLRHALETHQDRLIHFDRSIAEIPIEEVLDVDEVRIESVADLGPARERLAAFVDEIDHRVETARTAIEIFEEIERAEEREINHLFADDSYAVQFFSEVTDGNYTDVHYDEAENVVSATRVDGRTLPVDRLSQGTYDLLYMAIRVAIARDLLDETPGFLVFDDAFLHSDGDRIDAELDILADLAADGWQVVYFSIREEVREAVEGMADGRVTDLDPLEFDD